MAFTLLLVLLFWGFKTHERIHDANPIPITNDENTTDKTKIKTDGITKQEIITVLLADKLFQCLIFANVLCMFIYAQMDTSLIQYLTRAKVSDLLQLISTLIVDKKNTDRLGIVYVIGNLVSNKSINLILGLDWYHRGNEFS